MVRRMLFANLVWGAPTSYRSTELTVPRPERPPIFIGGAPPHALERAVKFGDGWLPMGGDPGKLKEPIQRLRTLASAAARPPPEVKLMSALPLDEPERAIERLGELMTVAKAVVVVRAFVAGSGNDFHTGRELASLEHLLYQPLDERVGINDETLTIGCGVDDG